MTEAKGSWKHQRISSAQGSVSMLEEVDPRTIPLVSMASQKRGGGVFERNGKNGHMASRVETESPEIMETDYRVLSCLKSAILIAA